MTERFRRMTAVLASGVALCTIFGCESQTSNGGTQASGMVTDQRLGAADLDLANWLTTGRTYGEARYSPLTQINDKNVQTLGLAWYQDLGTGRGQEATPIVVDGVIYVSTAWSIVKAFNARTGAALWTFDPQVPRDTLVKACCDAVNRGVAAWGGKIFVGSLDGRLIAIDATTGKKVWSTVTVDNSKDYTITGAPRVVQGKVIIGNSGADMGNVRGYVSAYDARTGKLAWRFYTVPGNPSKPFENATMEKARHTWKGDVWWTRGGGGTVWDAIAYDPDLDLLYIGTGNGGPWSRQDRSPGGGDNLFLSSIVALRPDTGKYVWHYQVNPGDNWDYTATQQMILTDLEIKGKTRKVLLQAPKNGFFYVLDRQTGKLLSAEKFAAANWATGIDIVTGRPIENPAARYDETGKPFLGQPGPRGAHSWQPMSYSKKTGLVYIPVQETSNLYVREQGFVPRSKGLNTGTDAFADLPKDAPASRAYLLAWNPVTQREAWRVEHPGAASGGGVLSTAGNLLLQGQANGEFAIYRADTGRELWKMQAQSMPMAGPISYAVAGEQYIAVMAGCGGDFSDVCGLVDSTGRASISDRLLVFKLGGKKQLPHSVNSIPMVLDPPREMFPEKRLVRGRQLYEQYCAICHGGAAVSSGLNPDLRHSGFLYDNGLEEVVLKGALKDSGMASFDTVLNSANVRDIRAYIINRALIAKKTSSGGSNRTSELKNK